MSNLIERIGKYDVLVSNSLNVFNYEDIVLELHNGDSVLQFRVKFLKEGNGPSISTRVEEDEMIVEMCKIFDFPGGLTEPIEVAASEDEKQTIFLMCSVLPLNKASGTMVLFYSFLSVLKA